MDGVWDIARLLNWKVRLPNSKANARRMESRLRCFKAKTSRREMTMAEIIKAWLSKTKTHTTHQSSYCPSTTRTALAFSQARCRHRLIVRSEQSHMPCIKGRNTWYSDHSQGPISNCMRSSINTLCTKSNTNARTWTKTSAWHHQIMYRRSRTGWTMAITINSIARTR